MNIELDQTTTSSGVAPVRPVRENDILGDTTKGVQRNAFDTASTRVSGSHFKTSSGVRYRHGIAPGYDVQTTVTLPVFEEDSWGSHRGPSTRAGGLTLPHCRRGSVAVCAWREERTERMNSEAFGAGWGRDSCSARDANTAVRKNSTQHTKRNNEHQQTCNKSLQINHKQV